VAGREVGDVQLAVVGVGQPPGDVQPEAQPSGSRSGVLGTPRGPFEDALACIGWDARALVLDGQHHLLAPTGAVMGQVAGWCAWQRPLPAGRGRQYAVQLPSGRGAAVWSPAAWIRASGPTTVPERLHRGQPTPTTGPSMPQLSADARDLNWLVANFATATPGVAHAMVVSADGLPVAVSDRLDRPMADQLAAIASGVAALSQAGAGCFEGGLVTQTLVEMQRGLLFVTSIRDGSCLTVLAAASCDVGLVGYEMAVLVTRVGDVLTPRLRAELQAALPA
jgi:uncharacterized protein